MNRFIRRYPSPSLVVSITALVVALGGAGYSATGGTFILGQTNIASTQTRLVAPFAGAAFRIDNTSAASGASGMNIVTNAARPPFALNSSTRVVNLNADKLDGLDSTALTRVHNVPYNLASGAVSAPISLPVDRPVQLVGVKTSLIPGVGQASLWRSSAGFVEWISFSYSDPNISNDESNVAGTPIVDLGTAVYVETAGPSTIRVHNNSSLAATGSVSLMW